MAAVGRGYARPTAQPGELSEHLSVSQVETLSDCGMKYRLQRVDGIQEIPAWWNIGGAAFHSTIEWWERQFFATGVRPGTGDTLKAWGELLSAERLRTDAATRIPRTRWRAGGRDGSKEDGVWWHEHGPLMVAAYVAAHQDDGPRICAVGDQPGVELEFTLDVDGIPVKGFIDQLRFSNRLGDEPAYHVIDLKAGRNKPGGTFQLGMYGQALRRVYGATFSITGQYWLARKGEYTDPIDLDEAWPWEAIVYRVHMAERIRRAGLYQPRESSFCGSCSVNSECPTRTGRWPKIT